MIRIVKRYGMILICLMSCLQCGRPYRNLADTAYDLPKDLVGSFIDDYDIAYTITNDIWIQHPGIQYQIIQYNESGQFIIAQNDKNNPTDPNLFTRIDLMRFSGMAPFTWGFCLTDYKAVSFKKAVLSLPSDRANPRSGCNGFPFSRMKRSL